MGEGGQRDRRSGCSVRCAFPKRVPAPRKRQWLAAEHCHTAFDFVAGIAERCEDLVIGIVHEEIAIGQVEDAQDSALALQDGLHRFVDRDDLCHQRWGVTQQFASGAQLFPTHKLSAAMSCLCACAHED